MYDEEGRCFCVCEDDSWSDLNLLGRASCVPVKAHMIYGWVGLVLSVAALCHAAYQLHRQVTLCSGCAHLTTGTCNRSRAAHKFSRGLMLRVEVGTF